MCDCSNSLVSSSWECGGSSSIIANCSFQQGLDPGAATLLHARFYILNHYCWSKASHAVQHEKMQQYFDKQKVFLCASQSLTVCYVCACACVCVCECVCCVYSPRQTFASNWFSMHCEPHLHNPPDDTYTNQDKRDQSMLKPSKHSNGSIPNSVQTVVLQLCRLREQQCSPLFQ